MKKVEIQRLGIPSYRVMFRYFKNGSVSYEGAMDIRHLKLFPVTYIYFLFLLSTTDQSTYWNKEHSIERGYFGEDMWNALIKSTLRTKGLL